MLKRILGRSQVEVSALGLGCMQIGGCCWRNGKWSGFEVDDHESTRAIHWALDHGVNLLDTADAYGCGHSEQVVGKALTGRRHEVVIATKFGNTFDEKSRVRKGPDARPEYIRRACEASLRRLGTDVIDLYQFHSQTFDIDRAPEVRDVLEELVSAGKIRWYGWSTDDPDRARVFAQGPHCAAVQQELNLFRGNRDTLRLCEQLSLASINRRPLAFGVLAGKFHSEVRLPEHDPRSSWDFRSGDVAERVRAVERFRSVLASDGRTLVQGVFGWIWAMSDVTIPIPGFRTLAQVQENVGALEHGPLSDEQMAEVARLQGTA